MSLVGMDKELTHSANGTFYFTGTPTAPLATCKSVSSPLPFDVRRSLKSFALGA